MAYTINKTNGSVITTLSDGNIDQHSTSLTLIGRKYAGYGELQNENFVKLLENFSNTTAPVAPIAGQLWWDTTTGVLNAYTGTIWKHIPSSSMGSSQPALYTFGDLWWDTTSNQLKVCDQAGVFKPAGGPDMVLSGDITGTGSQAIPTTLSATGVTAGNYGTASSTPTLSVDAKGRVTTASNTSINITSSQVSNFASTARTSVSANSGLTYNSTTGVFGVDTNVVATSASLAAAGGSALVGYTATGTGSITTTAQAKLREVVSVKDFGAVGDGVTNDQTALVAAVAAAFVSGASLNWPTGTYVSTASIPNMHSTRHTGPGVIKRGSNLFSVSPSKIETQSIYISETGVSTNDGLSATQPTTKDAAAAVLYHGQPQSTTRRVVDDASIPQILAGHPTLFGNSSCVVYNGGHQLRDLRRRLDDPFCQSVNICMIGDSITWGVGATGSGTTSPRDGTLSDPRDVYHTCSYVNLLKRYLRDMLGNGVTTVLANHPAAPSGTSQVTYTKQIALYPTGSDFVSVLSGGVTDAHVMDSAALLNSRRMLTCNPGAGNKVTLKFKFTGDSIDVVFGSLPGSGKYSIYVNGVQIGGTQYSTRTGDDGLTTGYSRSRSHTFPRVIGATIEFEATHYDNTTGVNAVYLEAFRFTKTVRIKNQGIIGATSKSYLTYNMPTTREAGATYYLPSRYTGLVATPAGPTSFAERAAASAIVGMQGLYGYSTGGSWTFEFPVSAVKPKINIAYSVIAGGGDIEILVGGTVISSWSTNSNAPGVGAPGYARIKVITLPAGTTTVTMRSVFATYGTGGEYVNYLYLEGIANYADSDIAYPSTNGFGDSVALATDDDFCFLQLGTNDRASSNTIIESVSEVKTNMESILSLMPLTTAKILMVPPPAQSDSMPTYALGMREIRGVLMTLGDQTSVDVIDNMTPLLNTPFGVVTSDGLHPSDLGHAIIASNIVTAINNA